MHKNYRSIPKKYYFSGYFKSGIFDILYLYIIIIALTLILKPSSHHIGESVFCLEIKINQSIKTSWPRRLSLFSSSLIWFVVMMRDLNSDLFDLRTVMDSAEFPRSVSSSSDADFGFAFNDSNFSDRQLRIEIMGESPDTRLDSDACTSIAEWARHRKRRREDIKKENGQSPSLSF